MKKAISKILVFVLMLGVFTAALPASAQEPVEEATVEATVEPTEEATVEPTEEATVEPTEEATVEPTEEATVEPTEEATVEPTEEATVEPTEEATVEPTEEAAPALEAADLNAQATYNQTTVFAVQNPNTSASTTVQIQIYDTSGNVVYNDSPVVQPGYAYLLDQASQTLTGFTQGSAVLSAGENMAATTLIKGVGSGATPRYDIYNGLTGTDLGEALTFPQVVRNFLSLGSRYNTTLVIQNTGGSQANITVAFKVGATTTASQNYSIPSNASVYIRSEDVTALGDQWFGYAVVSQSASPQTLAGIDMLRTGETTSSGSMVTHKGFARNITSADGEVGGGNAYKTFSSLGCSYSSAQSIINVGTGTAQFTVRYKPVSGYGSAVTYNTSLAEGGSTSLDQRYDSNLASQSRFFGSISFEVTSGEIVAINNLRGSGCDPTLNVSSVPVELASGTKLLIPMVMKYDTSGVFGSGFNWSSAVAINADSGSNTQVRVTYYPYDGSATTTYLDTVVAGQTLNTDQRYDTNLTPSTFRGSMIIEATDGTTQLFGQVNARGTGGAADAVGSYKAMPR